MSLHWKIVFFHFTSFYSFCHAPRIVKQLFLGFGRFFHIPFLLVTSVNNFVPTSHTSFCNHTNIPKCVPILPSLKRIEPFPYIWNQKNVFAVLMWWNPICIFFLFFRYIGWNMIYPCDILLEYIAFQIGCFWMHKIYNNLLALAIAFILNLRSFFPTKRKGTLLVQTLFDNLIIGWA